MKAHYLQHVPFEGPGYIELWLGEREIPLGCTRLFANDAFPHPDEFDLLIIMGGPMSVNDEELYPWLSQEKRFIRESIEAGKSILGVCLGAQLIASALGAAVYSGNETEIGWFPVFPVSGDLFEMEETVFHWHGETFDLPVGASHLARSEGCENQAFRFGERVVGLQFHLETTPQTVAEMLENGREELVPSAYIQDEKTILEITQKQCEQTNQLMGEILSTLLKNSL
ncbi:MAG: amidotransferase [Verrucomicrobiales bacterium]|nr:amidotransferase [Verrucomicrobiales bacterium]